MVLSHEHYDHTGGLEALLDTGVRPTTYLPEAFGEDIKGWLSARSVPIVEVGDQPAKLMTGLFSTGYFRAVAADTIIEQGLIVRTAHGWALITGCSHPGIVKMVERATQACGGPLALVMGGFHLTGYNASRLEDIAQELLSMGVRRVAPTHCSGDRAREVFASVFEEGYVSVGVGATVTLAP